MRRTAVTVVAGLLLVLGVGSCGNDDDEATVATEAVVDTADDTADDASDDTADDTADDTTMAATETTAEATGDGQRVTMQNFAFDPSDLTVAAGEVLTVTNDDSVTHTFTSDDGGFDTTVEAETTETVTMPSDPGTYEFACTIHPSMQGTITVE